MYAPGASSRPAVQSSEGGAPYSECLRRPPASSDAPSKKFEDHWFRSAGRPPEVGKGSGNVDLQPGRAGWANVNVTIKYHVKK